MYTLHSTTVNFVIYAGPEEETDKDSEDNEDRGDDLVEGES